MRGFANTAMAGVTLVAFGCGAWLLRSGAEHGAPPRPSAAQAHTPSEPAVPATVAALPPSPPERVRIPSLRVNAPLTGLGLTSTGSLDVPPAAEENLVGWYEAGTTPGENGTAILAGHVDNADGPAVFYRLGSLAKGARVEVERRDGLVARFSVDAVEMYAARAFPDEKVYGAADRPELRLITCGGGYSKRTGYQANVVVFAHLTGVRPASAQR